MKLTHRLGAKIVAIFLLVTLSCAALFGVLLTAGMTNDGFYFYDAEAQDRSETYYNAVEEYHLHLGRTQQALFPYRYTIPAASVALAVCCAALYLFLLCSAGRRAGVETAVRNIQDRIPFDVYLVSAAAAVLLLAHAVPTVFYPSVQTRNELLKLVLPSLFLEGIAIVALSLSMTLATRIKTRTLWRNTVIYRVMHACGRALCWMGRGIRTLFANLPFIWKTVLAFCTYAAAMFFLTIVAILFSYEIMLLLVVGINMAVLLLLCYFAMQAAWLKEGGRRLAEGDLSHHVPTERMVGAFRRHGEHLNNIGWGMSRAVDERMKSERLKTELITNVSHDIKTPLTSILNYVDLLKKEPAANAKAAEYIAVLDRSANRLKKMTEDVLEASKAATGNIKVELARTDAVELLRQCLGEYEERFRSAGLLAVMHAPGEPACIMADGRLLWRVFDNLLGNIAKYAQPGTRVYAGVERADGSVAITLKNISRDALNISEEELMERFVRGDSARSSEGSGLGLSIARSLTELQGGRFNIDIECDLFRAVLCFTAEQGGPETQGLPPRQEQSRC